jgi:hypothetical protein
MSNEEFNNEAVLEEKNFYNSREELIDNDQLNTAEDGFMYGYEMALDIEDEEE